MYARMLMLNLFDYARIGARGLVAAWLVSLPLAAMALEGPGAPSWVAHPSQGFEITTTEVSVSQFRACVEAGACSADSVSSKCNFGASEREDHPVNCVTYGGAEQYCAYAGGRICTEPEWLAACAGAANRKFPYGNVFDLGACNAQSQTETVEGRPSTTAPVASHWRCEGGLDGLFDMAGNVAEWVDSCKGDYCKFRGAGYLSNDPVDRFAGCSGVCSGNNKSLQSGVVGIRCCRSLSP